MFVQNHTEDSELAKCDNEKCKITKNLHSRQDSHSKGCSHNIFVTKTVGIFEDKWLLFIILDNWFFLTRFVVSLQELFLQLTGRLLVTDVHQNCDNVWENNLSISNTCGLWFVSRMDFCIICRKIFTWNVIKEFSPQTKKRFSNRSSP